MRRFSCARLGRYPGLLRVDGIGGIRATRDLGARLAFHFSEIKPRFIRFPFDKEAPTGKTYTLKGHSSWLRLFTPGSLWENGKKVGAARLENQEFLIDTSQCIYSLPNQVSSFAPYETLLPPNYLQFGHNHAPLTRTKYAFVPVLNHDDVRAKWLIIPTAELFRFYLGNSTRLISRALTATTGKLIDQKRTQLIDQVLTIFDLSGKLTQREACCYGRTLTGADAVETFFGPHKYLSASSLKGLTAPLYIDSRFPFKGRTSLFLTGKRIQIQKTTEDSSEWAVYVTQIRRCTHPYGISHVNIISTGAIGDGSGGQNYGAGGPPIPPKIDLEDELEINDASADPSRGTAIAGNLVYSSDPLSRITAKRINVSRDEFEGLRARIVNTPPSGYTFENASGGASGSGNQSLDLVEADVKDVSRDISQFIEMLNQLRIKTAHEAWEITTLACNNQPSRKIDSDVITSFPSMPSQYKWYLVSDSENIVSARPRHAIWVRIKIRNRYIYLVEMELRGNEPGRSILAATSTKRSNSPIELTEDNFVNLLTLTAVHRGWPPPSRRWKEEHQSIADTLFDQFEFVRLKHLYYAPLKGNNNDKNITEPAHTLLGKINKRGKCLVDATNNTEQATFSIPQRKAGSKVSPIDWASDVYDKLLDAFPS